MALDASTIAEGIQRSGGYYVAALAILAMVAVFWLFKSATDARIDDLKAEAASARAETAAAREAFRGHLAEAHAEVKTARENETAALRSVIPVATQMLAAISVAEVRARKRSDNPSATVPK